MQEAGQEGSEHKNDEGVLAGAESPRDERLLFYNMLSQMEKSIFTTAPKEVKAQPTLSIVQKKRDE